MAVTAQKVFDMAMSFMDKRLASGTIDANKTLKYKNKTLDIMTEWQTEMGYTSIITDLSQTLATDDKTALLTGAYHLASHLLLIEDPTLASFFNQKFEELKAKCKKPASAEAITDVNNWGI